MCNSKVFILKCGCANNDTHQEEAVDSARIDEQGERLHNVRLAPTVTEVPAQQLSMYPVDRVHIYA